MSQTTAIAVSGGLDSLYGLVLLREAARESGGGVVAVHGFFTPPTDADRDRAAKLQAVCDGLGVDLHMLDLAERFESLVIAPFAAEYGAGRTPNPCALCNPRVKFGLLLDRAVELGADRFATGHYARVDRSLPGRPLLARGDDPAKEQSYFLSLVPAERWERVDFPLARWTKDEARRELAARNITPPVEAESREICFVPDDDYPAFLQRREEPLPGPGPIVLRDGREVGLHRGLWRYTPGQRRGLGVAWTEPLYVLEKDVASNALVVGAKAEALASGCAVAEALVHLPVAEWPETVLARTRYRQQPRPASVAFPGGPREGRMDIAFHEPASPPAPGQVAAVYDTAGRVLAAGTIERAEWGKHGGSL